MRKMNLKAMNFIRQAFIKTSICRERRAFATKPCITVSAQNSLMDETVNITVNGLTRGSRVSIRSTQQERGNQFEAFGHFVADKEGTICLDKQESFGGSYTGVEAMGLFWSLSPAAGQRKGLRFAVQDVTAPVEFKLAVHSGHLESDSFDATQPVAETMVTRCYMRGTHVDRIKVHSGRVRAILFKPKGQGPFPGVVDLFGLAGGITEYRAALLASRGFAALALPYFNYEDLVKSYRELQFEYFEEAVNWLSSQTCVSPGGIGVLGLSLGGCFALEMASRLPQIKAVVSISSLPIIIMPLTYKGQQIASSHQVDLSLGYTRDGGYVTKDIMHFININKISQEELANIQNSSAHFLLVVGGDDQSFPATLGARVIVDKLRAHGKTNCEVFSYPRAGHLLEPPYQSAQRYIYNVPLGVVFDFGGEDRKAHAHACQDAWVKSLSFLRRHLAFNAPNDAKDATHVQSKL